MLSFLTHLQQKVCYEYYSDSDRSHPLDKEIDNLEKLPVARQRPSVGDFVTHIGLVEDESHEYHHDECENKQQDVGAHPVEEVEDALSDKADSGQRTE